MHRKTQLIQESERKEEERSLPQQRVLKFKINHFLILILEAAELARKLAPLPSLPEYLIDIHSSFFLQMERLELLLSNRTTNSRFKVSKGDTTVASSLSLPSSSSLAHSNLFLILALLTVCGALPLANSDPLSLEFPCTVRKEWYSTEVNKCVACTVCGDGEYMKRICHLDRDTICAPSHELRFHIEPLHLTKESNEVSGFSVFCLLIAIF